MRALLVAGCVCWHAPLPLLAQSSRRKAHCARVPLESLSMQSMDEDAVAAKLASMRRRSRRCRLGPQPSQPATPPSDRADMVSREVLPYLPGNETNAVPVWTVPEPLRMPGAPVVQTHGHHASLDDVFPGVGLGEAWATNSALRTALRRALRDDLFAPSIPESWSSKQREFALMLDSACMVAWTAAGTERTCSLFTTAFGEHDISLTGKEFLLRLGALCGPTPHGSLIDIIPLKRRVAHSWHQDSGISANTVLLGFPPHNEYEGGGVFSSHVKLSHPLRPSQGEEHGAVVEFERLSDEPIPEEYVLRPLYGRGREIWVSDDSTHVHSTPDRQCREALWRFM